ncbi:phosphatase PAP2 family protein [Photorhabdus heterorhabditis]|uniref:Phosphatase PAP2 family protein n=1 Tax=Photorhabdus heterorhabditis TaxID=880156 RepID=A0A5B0X2I5_9GAMM|nr:phosphatase PAP2 family protein [Photorhabdus heterorhabditis]MBS9440762.1 phosphatase PAP2 family protein [Photorhabdus heterorhabditis]
MNQFIKPIVVVTLILLLPRCRYILSSIVTIWVVSVLISRMALGMHWPQDLMMSTLISATLVMVMCYLTEKWRLINDYKYLDPK